MIAKIVIILLLSILFSLNIASATVSYATGVIQITGSSENLTTINQTINNKNLIEQLGEKEWLLKVPIQINSGNLYLNKSDNNWLKLMDNTAYIKSYGNLVIENTKITSWNTTTNDVVLYNGYSIRPYILAYYNLRIYNSNISYLGYSSGNPGIMLWSSSSSPRVENNTLINNWNGFKAVTSPNITISRNTILHSWNIGIELSYSDYSVINGNYVNGTKHPEGNEGIAVIGKYINITDNTVIDVDYNGIHLKGSGGDGITDYNIVNNNTVDAAWHSGIDVHDYSAHNIISNNTVFNILGQDGTGGDAIFVHNYGAHNNIVKYNYVYDSNIGTHIWSAHDNQVLNNIYNNVSTAIRVYSSTDNTIGNNTITNSIISDIVVGCGGYSGGYLNNQFGLWNNSFIDNTFSGIFAYSHNSANNGVYCSWRNETNQTIINPPPKFTLNLGTQHSLSSLNIISLRNNLLNTTVNNVVYYKTNSTTVNGSGITYGLREISLYPMTARPSSSPATVTMNSFNTSLPAGQVLVNFTANTTNGNNVHFTISTLSPGRNYKIKKGSSNFMNATADGSGTIAFDNSQWPSGAFTVQENEEQESGSASGTAARMNQTPIPYANVSLYYQNGAAYGQTVQSRADGRFTFSNITNGYYYVAVDKQLYRQNTSSVFNINSNSIDIGSIKVMCYDINGDNNIDVLDLNMIAQRINEITGTSYPSVDVNGDGIVDIHDVTLVSGQIEE